MTDHNARTELLALEQERRRALVEEDHRRVAELFADDLVYVHTTGLVQDKSDYLDYMRSAVQYLAIERGELQIRFYGEALAVMTGPQCNTLQKRGGVQAIRAEGFATQVWVRGAQGWRISSSTPLARPAESPAHRSAGTRSIPGPDARVVIIKTVILNKKTPNCFGAFF